MQQVLGVALGIATVCLLLSIIASHLQEVVAAFTSRRAVTLEMALEKMLDDPALLKKFIEHPLIQNISFHPPKFLSIKVFGENRPRPNYIASPLFSRVLLTSLNSLHGLQAVDFPSLVISLPDSLLKQRLQTLMVGIETNAFACNAIVEQWYDSTMERVNGFYKRRTQWLLMIIGLMLAILCNANLFRITSTLWLSKDARDSVAALSQVYGCPQGKTCTTPSYEQARKDLEQKLNPLPLGYKPGSVQAYWSGLIASHNENSNSPAFWEQVAFGFYTLGGWLLTAIAVSLGAPFWFDALNNLLNVNTRISGAKPPTAADIKAEADKAVLEVKKN